jgi:tripartite-type tricarboxylate transporter receptor subunit TctC
MAQDGCKWAAIKFQNGRYNMTRLIKKAIFGITVLMGMLLLLSVSWGAEKFPTAPVELINPFGAGGFNDIHCRMLASVANQYLGQPLIVSMKPGAGGVVGTAFVARSKSDGYTLLFGVTGPNSIACQVENTGYTKDSFVPIAKINHAPAVVAVNAEKPWKKLGDLINYIRDNPKKVVYGTTAVTGVTNFGNFLLLESAGIKEHLATVPFKGVGDQILSVLKGDTDYMVQVYTGLIPFIKSKEIRLLAVLDDVRLSMFPDVPTAKELGYDAISIMWGAILAPKGTPPEVVETLANAFDKMVKDPSFVAMMKKMDMPLFYSDRKTFQKYWDKEYKKYGEMIVSLGLKKK